MTTVIARQTVVTPKQGDYILFWADYGRPRAVHHGQEQFLVTATRLGGLGSGRFYEIQDERGDKSRWHPAHRFEVVE